MTYDNDWFRRIPIVTEAYCLLNMLAAGEHPSNNDYARAEFHLKSLEVEFPNLSDSRMAHELAKRLTFQANPYRWWTLGAGKWYLKLGPVTLVTFRWKPNDRLTFEIHAGNKLRWANGMPWTARPVA